MGLLPDRITKTKRQKLNKFLKAHLSPSEEIALDLKLNGPLKRNQRFAFTKAGPRRVRK